MKQTAAEILILAGTNGGGKSSVGGAFLRKAGHDYFNPDEATKLLQRSDPTLTAGQANSIAWREGRDRLEAAINQRSRFVLETTLGGKTITGLLLKATNVGIAVRVWFVGLASADLHVQRVRSRVLHGGHDIDEQQIRHRYDASRENLVRLVPHLTELMVYDNSQAADPEAGVAPTPLLVAHYRKGHLRQSLPVKEIPNWAKPIMTVIYASSRNSSRN